MTLIFALLGILSIIYGSLVVYIIGTGSWFNFAFIIFGAFLLAISFLWKKLIKLPKYIKIAGLCIISLCLVNFSIAEYHFISSAVSKPDDAARWVIVLGAKVKDDRISLEFMERIRAGISFANSNENVILVFTGGKGDDEPVSEGDAAANFAVSIGFDRDRIITENQSESTYENFKFAKKLMKERGYIDGDSVVVVSSGFHLYRAGKIAKAAGFDNLSFLGVTGKRFLLPQYYLREYAAYIMGHLKGQF